MGSTQLIQQKVKVQKQLNKVVRDREHRVIIYLMHRSEKSITITYDLIMVDQSWKKVKHYHHKDFPFDSNSMNSSYGGYIMTYSDILDKSKKVLSKDETLIISRTFY